MSILKPTKALLSGAALLVLLIVATTQPTTGASNLPSTASSNCIKVDGKSDKIVCVCSDSAQRTDCTDDLAFEWPRESGQAILLTSTLGGDRFRTARLNSSTSSNVPFYFSKIKVNLDARRQEILGWGGAFTDAATININSLPRSLARRLLASYYGPKGLEYNIGRVPIGGSDFSTRAYSYDDTPAADLNLTSWALASEDLEHKMPVIKEAMRMAGDSLKLFASPWSPPEWMKTNGNFTRGRLIDSDEIYRAYAQYLIKFFAAYRERGIEFWGATVQNEPVAAELPFYSFNSLQMNSAETIKFVGQYYGPALEAFGYNKSNFKLMVGDDSLGLLNLQLPSVMRDPQVQRYVAGLAIHWYTSGLIFPYDTLTKLLEDTASAKFEFVMMSEACRGSFPDTVQQDLGDWSRGESYASDIIEDLKRQTGAWIDWNLALDTRGGPNWSGNFADAPIIVDASKNLFYKQPMYYALAHFTKLIRPGSFVVDTQLSGPGLPSVSFIGAHKVDSRHAIVNVLNKGNSAQTFALEIQGANTARTIGSIKLEPRSVSSVVVKL